MKIEGVKFWIILTSILTLFLLFSTILISLSLLFLLHRPPEKESNVNEYQLTEINLCRKETTQGFVTINGKVEPDQCLSYRNEHTGSFIIISHFDGEEYECVGSCSCVEERRNSASVLARSLSVIFSALSVSVATKMAKDTFKDHCRKYESVCSPKDITVDIGMCSKTEKKKKEELSDLEKWKDLDWKDIEGAKEDEFPGDIDEDVYDPNIDYHDPPWNFNPDTYPVNWEEQYEDWNVPNVMERDKDDDIEWDEHTNENPYSKEGFVDDIYDYECKGHCVDNLRLKDPEGLAVKKKEMEGDCEDIVLTKDVTLECPKGTRCSILAKKAFIKVYFRRYCEFGGSLTYLQTFKRSDGKEDKQWVSRDACAPTNSKTQGMKHIKCVRLKERRQGIIGSCN